MDAAHGAATKGCHGTASANGRDGKEEKNELICNITRGRLVIFTKTLNPKADKSRGEGAVKFVIGNRYNGWLLAFCRTQSKLKSPTKHTFSTNSFVLIMLFPS